MKNRDLVNLLNRAAAALETPKDLQPDEVDFLIEDLTVAAEEFQKEHEAATDPNAPQLAKLRVLVLQQQILKKANEYRNANGRSLFKKFDEGIRLEGNVTFFEVGRNASHTFYVGVDEDGVLWRAGVDEVGTIEGSMKKATTDLDKMYLGHF